MDTKERPAEEKAKTWRLLEKLLGKTERGAKHRPDWRIHRETGTSLVLTFSKAGQLFYDVSKKDLEQFASYRRGFFIFVAGSHKDVFIVPLQELRERIMADGLKASQEYADYKLHLVRDFRGTYFREIPTLNLAAFLNQYAQLL